MEDCLFCKIAAGDAPADILYRDEQLLVLKDINPQAPTHLLILPIGHYANLAEAAEKAPAMVGALLARAAALGKEYGAERGFRLVVNTGPDGGQTVAHVHFHLLAGRALAWPPG